MKRARGEPADEPAPNAKRATSATACETVAGDLLECEADVIAHQCNCVTVKGRGLYSALVDSFPYCDVYSRRKDSKARPRLGSVELCKPADLKSPIIACLYAQLGPGKPGQASKKYGVKASADSAEKRLEYFSSCLSTLADKANAEKWKKIAFPHNIGCGLAGGNWKDYSCLLDDFAIKLPNTTVCLFKKD